VKNVTSSGRFLHMSALPLVLGAIHALAFAPRPLPAWSLPFVQVFVLAALLFRLQTAVRHRDAAAMALAFGLGHFGLGLYWLYNSMHVHGGLAPPPAALGVLALAAYLSLYPVLATLLARRLTPAGPAVQTPETAERHWARQLGDTAVWASAWTLGEWLRGTLLTGFPWLNIAYAHVEGVLAPWAPLVGAYGLAWLAAFAAAAIAALARHKDSRNDARSAVGVGVAIVIGLAGIGLGHVRWTQPLGDPLIIRLVQGNVPQAQKFDPALFEQGLNQYLMLADLPAKADDARPALIALPETVIPVFQSQVPDGLWEAWRAVAARHEATILMGVPLAGPEPGRYTNSAITLDANTPIDQLVRATTNARYDKHHLVPFGEFIPPGFAWFVNAMRIPLGNFSAGPVRQALFPLETQRIAPDICYEDVFGEEILRSVRDSAAHGPGASILINLSNLAWFGDTWAQRQHLQIARMRALETGRPMLRATNTGMTAAIAPDGRVGAVLQPWQAGVLDVEVQGMQGLTPYVKTGNAPVLGLCLALLALAGHARWRGRSHERSPKCKPGVKL